jgi:hypothetical protein
MARANNRADPEVDLAFFRDAVNHRPPGCEPVDKFYARVIKRINHPSADPEWAFGALLEKRSAAPRLWEERQRGSFLL